MSEKETKDTLETLSNIKDRVKQLVKKYNDLAYKEGIYTSMSIVHEEDDEEDEDDWCSSNWNDSGCSWNSSDENC